MADAYNLHGRDLTHNALRVLLRMAHSALDKPRGDQPAAVYWGGWESLALACGYAVPDEDGTDETRKLRRTAHERARAAVAELVARGIVKREGTAGRGQRQRYRLLL